MDSYLPMDREALREQLEQIIHDSVEGPKIDYKSDHDTREEAQHAARKQLQWCDWAELVDLQTGVRQEATRNQPRGVERVNV